MHVAMTRLGVRPMEAADIDNVISYWLSATPEFLLAMGADPAKVPTRERWQQNLERLLATPRHEATTCYLIWLVDGRAVGYSSMKNVVYGDRGEMHLHMWDPTSRGRGHGSRLFAMAALEFLRLLDLRHVICEPSATNQAPNRLLRKIGFPLVKTYRGVSSDLSLECELNRYDILPEIARNYLRRAEAGDPVER